MKNILKRVCTGFLALATVITTLPATTAHAAEKQYWAESAERVGIIEQVMNDGSIKATFNEGYMKVEGETAYCIDINTAFKNGYKTRADASTRMSADQISDVALSIEYVKQYVEKHKELNYKQVYLLEQVVVWQRLSVHLGWQCDNVRAAYSEIPKATQEEVFAGAKAFVKENKGRYECGGYIYSGEGQELGQFWAKLNVGNAKLQKVSSNTGITDGNANYSLAGATYGVFADKECQKQLATLTTDENGNTDVVEVKAGTVYIKELSAPLGFQVDTTVYSLNVKFGETTTLKVSDTPKVTDTLIELFKIDMETQKNNPQGTASLAGAEFRWNYYDGFYTKDNLPSKPTRTWTTRTVEEKDKQGNVHYITKLADTYKVSGDAFYMQNGKAVLPLGTLTVEEVKSPSGYLLEGAYMQANGSSEQIKGVYLTQITEDGDLAVLTGANQFSVSDKVIRGGVKIQKRDLETGDTKPQGNATLKDTAFDIISLNDNKVLVEGKLHKKNEVVKTIHTDISGVAMTSDNLLPYGKYKISEQKSPEGYLTDGAKEIEFEITENGKIVDLTDKDHSIYNQIKRGDIEGVKIGAGTHKRLADVPFKITSKTTGESHIVVTDDNGQFSTSSDWASHKYNTNKGQSSEDGVWFGTSEPNDSKGALPYDTYIIEELRCESNQGFKLIPPFEIVVSRNNHVIDLGTLTDEYEKEITIHTTATGEDGEKTILAGKEVTIIDTVKLDGLVKGTKYQLKGWQMVKEENAELMIDGKRVENDYTFVADDEEMKVEIAYTFNASALGGKNLVTFEELYDVSNPKEPFKVAEHLSTIGAREGLAGAKSGLFHHAIRIIQEMRCATDGKYPVIAVWENVRGAFSSNDRLDFRAVLESFADTEIPMPASRRWANAGMVRGGKVDVCWRLLDAQYWGEPTLSQRRKRIFVVADFRGQRAAEILFKPHKLHAHIDPGRKSWLSSGERNRISVNQARGKIPILCPFEERRTRGSAKYQDTQGFVRSFGRPNDPFPTLLAGGPGVFSFWYEGEEKEGFIRYLTPIESERLMGLPDDWTKYGNTGNINSDYARWRALGNAIAVPCAEHIMAGIAEVLKESED